MKDTIYIEPDTRISVIIPCYNHGNFLSKAIQSVIDQRYPELEVIVVDDGSSDNTHETVLRFPEVRYIFQENRGLAAARNEGIRNCTGDFLVFLDADDWLEQQALRTNLEKLLLNPGAAFVSGGHRKISPEGKIIEECRMNVGADHYLDLLQGNYIGMHAAVMYRRWIFDRFSFDETLRACEDYDLYLKIARNFPVLHHSEIIAYYLIHGNNMSANTGMMLKHVLDVLQRQRNLLKNNEEITAWKRGKKVWTAYYKPPGKTLIKIVGKRIKKLIPDTVLRLAYRMRLIDRFTPRPGNVRPGDLKRFQPFSKSFGYDRGGPVDRYYIEQFLLQHANAVYGRVLEIGDNDYTLKYGGSKVASSEILHIDAENKKATIIGDLSNAPQIPDNSFDCIILTQTLHFIFDFTAALSTCFRILRPGGCLLMTVPGITQIDQGEDKKYWLWAFTEKAITMLLNQTFGAGNSQINTYGNVFTATAFLYGMSLKEIQKEYLEYHDPHYQVIITAMAIKNNQP